MIIVTMVHLQIVHLERLLRRRYVNHSLLIKFGSDEKYAFGVDFADGESFL